MSQLDDFMANMKVFARTGVKVPPEIAAAIQVRPRWKAPTDDVSVSQAADRLEADEYDETIEGSRQWARDGITVDNRYFEEKDAVRTTVLATLRHNGEHALADQVDEYWA